MFCKYCGNEISPDNVKCQSCGADIDLKDGGQSFFDDNELNAWLPDMPKMQQISMPKTEMREAIQDTADSFEEDFNKVILRNTSASRSHSGMYSQSFARRKKKKTLFDYMRLSNNTKLIMFCISSVLAIVLLVVAIIAVLTGENEQISNDSNSTQQDAQSAPIANNSEQNDNVTSVDKDSENPYEKENNSSENQKQINNIKIFDENDKEINYDNVSAYEINKVLYLSLDKILENKGYKKRVPEKEKNRFRYEHKQNNDVISIQVETTMIWLKPDDDKNGPQYLGNKSFRLKDDGDIYVPAESFLNKWGYSKVQYDSNSSTLHYYK